MSDYLNYNRDILLKILIIGDFGVGKTSIVRRFTQGTYTSAYKITIGADFGVKQMILEQRTRVTLQLWDIAGHERFGHLTRVYYKYAVGAAIVFDLSRIETIDSIEKWAEDLRNKVHLQTGDKIPVIIFANKCDINTIIPTEKLKKICEKYELLGWHFVSAKENINIDQSMEYLTKIIINSKIKETKSDNKNIILNNQNNKKETKNNFFCC